jgi:hypothetical protein
VVELYANALMYANCKNRKAWSKMKRQQVRGKQTMSRKIVDKNGNEDEEMDTHDRHLMTTVRAVFAKESQHGI